MRASCMLLMTCLPTMMTRSSCASSMRQPPAAHCGSRAQVSWERGPATHPPIPSCLKAGPHPGPHLPSDMPWAPGGLQRCSHHNTPPDLTGAPRSSWKTALESCRGHCYMYLMAPQFSFGDPQGVTWG